MTSATNYGVDLAGVSVSVHTPPNTTYIFVVCEEVSNHTDYLGVRIVVE